MSWQWHDMCFDDVWIWCKCTYIIYPIFLCMDSWTDVWSWSQHTKPYLHQTTSLSKEEVEQNHLTLAHKLYRALNSRFVDLLTGFLVQWSVCGVAVAGYQASFLQPQVHNLLGWRSTVFIQRYWRSGNEVTSQHWRLVCSHNLWTMNHESQSQSLNWRTLKWCLKYSRAAGQGMISDSWWYDLRLWELSIIYDFDYDQNNHDQQLLVNKLNPL